MGRDVDAGHDGRPTAPGIGRSGTTRRMTTQPGTKNRIGQTRTTAVSGTSQANEAARTRRPRPEGARVGGGSSRRRLGRRARRARRQGVPQRDDDSEHDRANDPPRRPRRVLRGGRAARPPGAARAAGHRRRGRAARTPAASCRRPATRRAVFGIHSAMSLREAYRRCPGRGLPAGRRPALPGGQPRRHGDPSAVHAAGRADLDRRGVPRRDRVGGAVRRRADDRAADQGRDAGGGRADRLGRRRHDQARRQDRLGPAQAGRAGRRAARRGGGLPRAAADRPAVGRRREDRGRARRVRRPDDRRPGGAARRTSSSGGSGSTARRSWIGRAGSMPIRSTTAIRPSRSATSTRSTSTRATPRSSSGRSSRWPTASPAGCARPASGPARSRSRSATAASGRSPGSGRCRSRPT